MLRYSWTLSSGQLEVQIVPHSYRCYYPRPEELEAALTVIRPIMSKAFVLITMLTLILARLDFIECHTPL